VCSNRVRISNCARYAEFGVELSLREIYIIRIDPRVLAAIVSPVMPHFK